MSSDTMLYLGGDYKANSMTTLLILILKCKAYKRHIIDFKDKFLTNVHVNA